MTTNLNLLPKLMCGAVPPLPPPVFMAWCLTEHRIRRRDIVIVKHRDKFTFFLPLLTLLSYILLPTSFEIIFVSQ
jgi:hypothetical protein